MIKKPCELPMRFRSRPEAYLYALYVLENIPMVHRLEPENFEAVIESIKICIENHEQNPENVAVLIDALQVENTEDKARLRILSAALKNTQSFVKLSDREKWEAPLARRLESAIHIELLTNPTAKMMEVINKVSQKIIPVLNGLEQDSEDMFLTCLSANADSLVSFGNFKKQPTMKAVIALLKQNSSKQIPEILFIHLFFISDIARNGKIMGDVARIVKKIANEKMYRSPYYKDRGRKGSLLKLMTSQMGLQVCDKSLFEAGFPIHSSQWVSDARSQQPDFNSYYVQSLMAHDTPYVAGPSGLTSVFMGGMCGLNWFDLIEEKQLYILGFASYIVAGGFHCLHEVLGAIAYCLPEENLIPGYQTSIPDENANILSPHYHVFYALIETIDVEFSIRREKAWQNMLSFFRDFYLPTANYLKPYHDVNEKLLRKETFFSLPTVQSVEQAASDKVSTISRQSSF